MARLPLDPDIRHKLAERVGVTPDEIDEILAQYPSALDLNIFGIAVNDFGNALLEPFARMLDRFSKH